jgi:type IV pilus biogenesis protein CpaD/CtpE
MRTLLALPVLMALAACQAPDPAAYNHRAAHPMELRETPLRMALGSEADLAASRARQFAAQRPNNGSSFVIAAEPAMAEAVRRAVIGAGVDPRDVAVAPLAGSPELTRIDRFASVANCAVPPVRQPLARAIRNIEDGFSHSNVNSSLLGCSVRNNVVQMTDDPRVVAGPVHDDDRDGARAAEVYQGWVKGKPTYTDAKLPSWNAKGTK